MAQIPDAISGNLDSFTHSSSGEEGLAALPSLRSGGEGDEPHPINPRNSLITPDETLFAWSEVEDVIEYKVKLTGPGHLAGEYETSKTTWKAEEDFTPGEQWGWRVEAVTIDGGITSDEVAFEVASRQKLSEFESLTAQLKPLFSSGEATSVDAATYLMGSYCRTAGFYNRAIVHFEALSERHPERKELHEELGFLYQAIGRNDKAAEEYRIALKE
jgi:tetratricopeptide (TPR) repeat protein